MCRHKIRPETVAAHIRAFLAKGSWQGVESAGARVWESVRGQDRFMDLASLSGHDAADRTKWVRLQRHVYRQFLDQEEPAPYPRGPVQLSAKAHSDALGELVASEKLLHLLSEQAQVLTRTPVESIKNKFLASWQRLQAMWDASKYLNVLGYLWLSESQESGQDMAGVAQLVRRYHALVRAWVGHLSE